MDLTFNDQFNNLRITSCFVGGCHCVSAFKVIGQTRESEAQPITFSNLMGVFSSDRLSLTLSGLTNDFEGTFTMTATNEAGSTSETVELVIESRYPFGVFVRSC